MCARAERGVVDVCKPGGTVVDDPALAGAAAVAVGMLVYSGFVLLAAPAPAPDPIAAATGTVASNPDHAGPAVADPAVHGTALGAVAAVDPGGPSPSGDGAARPSGEPGTTSSAPTGPHVDAPSDNLEAAGDRAAS